MRWLVAGRLAGRSLVMKEECVEDSLFFSAFRLHSDYPDSTMRLKTIERTEGHFPK